MRPTIKQIRAAAKAEAMAAWEEGWRAPQVRKAARLAGARPCGTNDGLYKDERAAIKEVFAAITQEQSAALIAEAKLMHNEGCRLNLSALERRLGIKPSVIATAIQPGRRFSDAVAQVEVIFGGRLPDGNELPSLERCRRCDTPATIAPLVGIFCQNCEAERRAVIRRDELNMLELQRMRRRLQQKAS